MSKFKKACEMALDEEMKKLEQSMADNEIIKALECASYYDCDKCPHHQENCDDRIADQYELSKEALDLINRLQAENENYSHNVKQLASDIRNYQIELQAMRNSANSFKSKYKSAVDTAKTLQSVIKEKDAEIKRLEKENKQFADIGKMYSEIKTEAIKEFADEIQKEISIMLKEYYERKKEREFELEQASYSLIIDRTLQYYRGKIEVLDAINLLINTKLKEMAGDKL